MINAVVEKRQFPRVNTKLPLRIADGLLGETLDLSENGLRFVIDRPLLPTETRARIEVSPEDSIDTEFKVAWDRPLAEEDKFAYGVSFIGLEEDDRETLRKIFKKFLDLSILNKDFLIIVGEFKDFMIQVEGKCREFEKSSKELTHEEQIEFINSQKDVFEKIDSFFYKLFLITKDFSREQILNHQKFIQEQILYYFMRDTMPLNKQIYSKPFGYAGDYITMNYLYENGYPGEDSYSKLIDKYTLSVSLACAHIYRRSHFRNAILDIIEKNNTLEEIKITSIACGPAVEILDVLREYNPPEKVKFFCIDGERKAIDQIQSNLEDLETTTKKKFSINLLNENILQMIRKKIIPEELRGQSFIYCAGFFDYLSDRSASMVLKYLFGLLKEDGVLIVVNIYKGHSCKVYLEMLGEWYLKERDEKEMMKIAEGLSTAKEIKIDFDPETKTNIYLIIKK